ncbi:hypothetical protein BHE90_005719 [Fusarium euwallaceae]|uniref:Uncharacterized protein n=1 Tax=Fusarium euwallaceae TaxID=1147111 RepID=A0A430LVL8_9HYPO|nr:hypothetical protein BHE90_005719 [Fusarium euwallaceae]
MSLWRHSPFVSSTHIPTLASQTHLVEDQDTTEFNRRGDQVGFALADSAGLDSQFLAAYASTCPKRLHPEASKPTDTCCDSKAQQAVDLFADIPALGNIIGGAGSGKSFMMEMTVLFSQFGSCDANTQPANANDGDDRAHYPSTYHQSAALTELLPHGSHPTTEEVRRAVEPIRLLVLDMTAINKILKEDPSSYSVTQQQGTAFELILVATGMIDGPLNAQRRSQHQENAFAGLAPTKRVTLLILAPRVFAETVLRRDIVPTSALSI